MMQLIKLRIDQRSKMIYMYLAIMLPDVDAGVDLGAGLGV